MNLAYLPPMLAWSVVIVYVIPSIWDIARQRPRFGDAARLVCFGFATIILGFTGRRALVGEPVDQSLVSLLTLATVMAAVTIWAAHSYGRGPRIPPHG